NPDDRFQRNYFDFISCFVVEGRAIYFSNFQPAGDDRFTRTFFIDLAISGYQRGRLAERLQDIATFRTMCVRDVNRVRSMIRGMDELNRELNDLPPDIHDSALHQPEGTEQGELPIGQIHELETLRDLLKRLDNIQEQLDQMNLFVAYGIRGRHLSVT